MAVLGRANKYTDGKHMMTVLYYQHVYRLCFTRIFVGTGKV